MVHFLHPGLSPLDPQKDVLGCSGCRWTPVSMIIKSEESRTLLWDTTLPGITCGRTPAWSISTSAKGIDFVQLRGGAAGWGPPPTGPWASPFLRSQVSPVPARVATVLQGDVGLDANARHGIRLCYYPDEPKCPQALTVLHVHWGHFTPHGH